MSAFGPLRTVAMRGIIGSMRISRTAYLSLGAFGTLCLGSLAVSPAHACEYVTWPFQLPGETEQEARNRSAKILSDQLTKAQFEREDFDLKNAQTIYIARVLSTNRGQGTPAGPMSLVEPVAAISGKTPTRARTLVEAREQGCSNWGDGYGDGEGTGAPIGTLVVVFEGLPKTEKRPNGIDSLRATSVRRGELLERLGKYSKYFDEGAAVPGQ